MKKSIHEFRRFLFATIMLLGVGVTAWGETVTIQAGSSPAGSEFSYSNLGAYSYDNSYWAVKNNSTVITIANNANFTFTNVNGATINSIVVKGVAQNNGNQNSTITISDGEHDATTGVVSWANRKNTEANITSQTLTGVADLKMTEGTVYTVSNSGYALGIQIEIDYTKGTGGGDCTPLAVNFAAGEGTGSMDADECCPEKIYVIPACEFTAPTGKIFNGWTSSDVEIVDGQFTMPSVAVTLTATWVDKPNVVVLEARGSSVSANGTFTNSTCTTSVAFGGTSSISNGTEYSPYSAVATDVAVKRTGSVGTITLGLVSTSASQIVVAGTSSGSSARMLSAIAVDGVALDASDYEVSGTISNNTTVYRMTISGLDIAEGSNVTLTFSGNVNFYYFEITPAVATTKYHITYAKGDAAVTGTLPTQVDLAEGKTFVVKDKGDLAWAGHNFTGWNDGTADYAAGASYTMGAADVVLTAQWEELTAYTVTYALGEEATGTLPTEENHYQGEKFTLAAQGDIKKEGYDFAGWNDGANTYNAGVEYTMPADNVTLTAQWTVKTVSDKKQLTQVVFDNGFDAFINETAKTVTAYYLAGTAAPTVKTTAQSEKASAAVDGATITVTAEDASTVDYTIVLAEVTPAEFGEYTFNGEEDWVKTGYTYSSGWRFSKNYDTSKPTDAQRIIDGRNRLYFFVRACEKLELTWATQRAIKVYRNGVEVTATTVDGVLTIPCDLMNASMIAVVSNQNSGDGKFSAANVKDYEVTCPASVAITGTKAYGFGETIELTATQTGSNTPENVTYQWYKDEVAIDGATANVFTKADAAAEDAGSYVCKVKQGECDEVASEAYVITVSAIEATSFTIASDLGDLKEIKAGTTFQVTVTITPANATDKTVAWRSELTSGNPYFTMTEGNPTTVTAVLPCSSAKKVYAKVGSLSEKNVSVKVYYEVEFANCDAIEPMKFYGNGIDLPTPTGGNEPFVGWYDNAEFTGSAIKLTGYKPEGNVTLYAKWTMPNAETPTITTQPQSANYEAGAVVAPLTVEASVTEGALSYQWYKGTTAIAGATEASYTPEESGSYKVVVTNTLADHNPASATSDIATITIAKAVLEQVKVTASTTWDWANAADAEVGKVDDGLLANIVGIKNNAEFNSQALLAQGIAYACRVNGGVKFFQGKGISFETTVAGLVTVAFNSTGNSERTIKINDKVGEETSSTSNGEPKIVSVPVMPGVVDITGYVVADGKNDAVRIYSIEFEAADYSRNLNGMMGTHCYPFTIPAGSYMGAVFYTPSYREGDTKIFWDEVTGDIEAGKPYLMVPEEDADIVLAFDVQESSVVAQTVNGFVGFYDGEQPYKMIAANAGNYIVYENQFRLAGNYVAVGANRAYIHLDGVSTTKTSAPAGARRFVMHNADSQEVTTELENVSDDADIRKIMINGQLFIIRGEKMYNVEGQLVK